MGAFDPQKSVRDVVETVIMSELPLLGLSFPESQVGFFPHSP